MILYYRGQDRIDGVWCNDETFAPLAVKQEDAYLLIETMDLDDDTRLIRIEKSEAMDNAAGHILWVTPDNNGSWGSLVLPMDAGEPFDF